VARRNVDQQIPNVTEGDGLEMLDNGVDVPAGHERRRWLDDQPRLARELAKAASCPLLVNLGQEGGSFQQ
jgi:hypothetical protein